MRHQKSGRILGRNSSHRKAMFRNMAASLFRYEQIRTTEDRAGGYTRILRCGLRAGDSAPMAYVQLLDKPDEVTPGDN